MKKAVLITLDTNLLRRIDEYVVELGHGSKRNGVIAEAAEYYLNIRKGFKNTIRRRQIEVEERTK